MVGRLTFFFLARKDGITSWMPAAHSGQVSGTCKKGSAERGFPDLFRFVSKVCILGAL